MQRIACEGGGLEKVKFTKPKYLSLLKSLHQGQEEYKCHYKSSLVYFQLR